MYNEKGCHQKISSIPKREKRLKKSELIVFKENFFDYVYILKVKTVTYLKNIIYNRSN